MGHSSVFYCIVKHRELNKNRRARECTGFFDTVTRDSYSKTKMLQGMLPSLSRDDYECKRDLVPLSLWGNMEELIDSSPHIVWEEQTFGWWDLFNLSFGELKGQQFLSLNDGKAWSPILISTKETLLIAAASYQEFHIPYIAYNIWYDPVQLCSGYWYIQTQFMGESGHFFKIVFSSQCT